MIPFEAATRRLAAGDVTSVVRHLHALQETTLEALQEMRLLIFELRPPLLAQEGLAAALQTRLEAVEGRTSIETKLVVEGALHFPAVTEQALYRIAQEALNNALRHAHARHVTVSLRQQQDALILEVADDGAGFDPTTARDKGGLGLRGIKERVAQLGGRLLVASTPGAGTLVRVEIRCMSDSISVLIVDDHLVVRKGIEALLETEADIVVVGEASNGAEAISAAAQLQPDVILMDLVMPQVDGVTAIERILSTQPEMRILVLTSFAADEKVFPAIRAGALGYIMKDAGAGELLGAIRQVQRGEPSLPPAIARKVLHELAHPAAHPLTTDPLTEREVEVLRLLAQGESNKEIGAHLDISEATVRKHVSNILSKLHLASRTQAALFAVREGLVPPTRDDGS